MSNLKPLLSMTLPYIIFTDGAKKGRNGDGPSSSGFVVYHDESSSSSTERKYEKIFAFATGIGNYTNNHAEYQAVILALDWVLENVSPNDRYIHIKSDSELMVRQLTNVYRCQSATLQTMVELVKMRLAKLQGYKIEWIPREQNTEADEICNRTLKEGAPVEECFEVIRARSEPSAFAVD